MQCSVCDITDVKLYRTTGTNGKAYCRKHVIEGETVVPMLIDNKGQIIGLTPSVLSALARWMAERDVE